MNMGTGSKKTERRGYKTEKAHGLGRSELNNHGDKTQRWDQQHTGHERELCNQEPRTGNNWTINDEKTLLRSTN